MAARGRLEAAGVVVLFVAATIVWIHLDVRPRDGPIGLGLVAMAPLYVALGYFVRAPLSLGLTFLPVVVVALAGDRSGAEFPLWAAVLMIAVPYGLVLVGLGALVRKRRSATIAEPAGLGP